MAEVIASGIRFHVQRLPAHLTECRDRATPPPSVVFVHGLVADNMSGFYYTLANPAARAGADVILYDMRGHGGTERPPTGYSLADAVRDLTSLLDAMEVTTPVHVVGNSFGGTVALALAMAHPERVASLCLIEAGVVTGDWVERLGRIIGKAMELRGGLLDWRAEHGRRRYRIHAAIDALVNGTSLAADLRATPSFPTAALRSVTCPVAAVYGENSDTIEDAHTLAQLLPNCELTIVPSCTHFLLAEDPGTVRDLLLRQLAGAVVTADRPLEKAPA
jgi:pimeloyl-ACP methyl ester carboxylesterase